MHTMHTMARPLSDTNHRPTVVVRFPLTYMYVWVHARCDGKSRGWVSTVDNLQVDCMIGMHLPLSMRTKEARTDGKGREEGGGLGGQVRARRDNARHRLVSGTQYLSWLRQDLQDKRLEAAVPTDW